MAPAREGRSNGRRRWKGALLIRGIQGQHAHLYDRSVHQRRLGRRRGEQVQVRVVAAVVLADELEAGGVVMVRRGMGAAMVVCRVVVREAVTHLRKE